MGYNPYFKDTVEFKVDGHDIKLHVTRLNVLQQHQLEMKASRIDEEKKELSNISRLTLGFIELLAFVVDSIEGVDGIEWPSDFDERVKLLNGFPTEFILEAAVAYKSKTNVDDGEEGK